MTVIRARFWRWLVPLSVLALIAGGAAWRSATANAAPSLPRLSAQQLLVKVAQTKVQSLSGTVAATTDLGLPALPGGADLSVQSLLTSGTHTLRVYADGPQRQRVDLIGAAAETDVVHNGRDLWQWSSSTRTATHAVLPDRTGAQRPRSSMSPHASMSPWAGLPSGTGDLTPSALAAQLLRRVGPSTAVSVGTPVTVAGRPADDLRLTPRSPDSTIGHADVYVDSRTGLPLCVGVTARHSTTEAIDIRYTSLTLERPAASVFAFSPPPGATVKQNPLPARHVTPDAHARPTRPAAGSPRVLGSDWSTVIELPGVDLTRELSPSKDGAGDPAGNPLAALLGSSQRVSGAYGSGRLLSTRLVSLLLTDDGRVFVGAVSPSALLRAAAGAGPR